MRTAAALPDCITRQSTRNIHDPNCDYCRQNVTRQCIQYLVPLTQIQADTLTRAQKLLLPRCQKRLRYDAITGEGRAFCDDHPQFCSDLKDTYKTTCGPDGPTGCVRWDQDKTDYKKMVDASAEAQRRGQIATACADQRQAFMKRCVHPTAWNRNHFKAIEIARAIAEDCGLVDVELRREVMFKERSLAKKQRKAEEKAARDRAAQSNKTSNMGSGYTASSSSIAGNTRSASRKKSVTSAAMVELIPRSAGIITRSRTARPKSAELTSLIHPNEMIQLKENKVTERSKSVIMRRRSNRRIVNNRSNK